MSHSECVKMPETENPWTEWRAGVKNNKPELYGTGKVVDRGLQYKKPGQKLATVWGSTIDDMDQFQLKLNEQGVTQINRVYRIVLDKDSKFPGPNLQVNSIATRLLTWPSVLAIGDAAELYVWNDGEFTQIAYKKVGG